MTLRCARVFCSFPRRHLKAIACTLRNDIDLCATCAPGAAGAFKQKGDHQTQQFCINHLIAMSQMNLNALNQNEKRKCK